MRDADAENGLVDRAGGGAGGMSWEEQPWQIHTALGKTESQQETAQGARWALWQRGRGIREEGQGGQGREDIRTPIADQPCGAAGTNPTL